MVMSTLQHKLKMAFVVCVPQVMSGREFASLADWLGCSKPLCPVVVRDSGRIEDAEPGLSQVCFLSPHPGGDTLKDGRSQVSRGSHRS